MNTTESVVIIGFGWVGQANALALSHMGLAVGYFDTSEKVTHHYASTHAEAYEKITRLPGVLAWEEKKPWYIVCVGDKVNFDTGAQDISLIEKALGQIEKGAGRRILRSTVIPSSLQKLPFDIYLPEFLHEKYAVEESINPFYFVVGARENVSEPAFFKEWERRAHRVFRGTPEEASKIKYLSNIWNSVRIAFTNEFGDAIGERTTKEGVAKIERMIDFVMERRPYQRYGRAFDGHCLPKDTRAFMEYVRTHGTSAALISGTYETNLAHAKAMEDVGEQIVEKVFSAWDPHVALKPRSQRLEEWARRNPALSPLRPLLRTVKKVVEQVMPARPLSTVASIWDSKASENPLYYMNTKTRSGSGVTEEEFKETGAADFERYIKRDPRLQASLQKFKEQEVLEIGCGIGRMTGELAKSFTRVTGLDISEAMLAEARKRLSGMSNVTLVKTDGTTIPALESTYTFIFSYLTLQHLPAEKDVDAVLKEIHRTLKKGGVAKVQLRTGTGVSKWQWSYGVSLPPQEAIKRAEAAGLRVLEHSVDDIKNLWLTLEHA